MGLWDIGKSILLSGGIIGGGTLGGYIGDPTRIALGLGRSELVRILQGEHHKNLLNWI